MNKAELVEEVADSLATKEKLSRPQLKSPQVWTGEGFKGEGEIKKNKQYNLRRITRWPKAQ